MLNAYLCRLRVKYLKRNCMFHGQANSKVESLLHMQEFCEHLKALMQSLNLAFSLTGMSELIQRVCVKMKGKN